MTLQECYSALGGDYQDVVSRLCSERMVQRFVLKFLDDGSYDLLVRSLEGRNYEEAFRAAHTIKGMCLNLGFNRLQTSSSELTEALRAGQHEEAERLFPVVAADYQVTVDAITAFKAGLESA